MPRHLLLGARGDGAGERRAHRCPAASPGRRRPRPTPASPSTSTLTPATVSPGDSMASRVTADVDGAPEGETLFGRITLTPSNAGVPTVTMPVAVVPSSGVLPDAVEFETRRNAGSQLVPGIQSIGVTEFTGSMDGIVQADPDRRLAQPGPDPRRPLRRPRPGRRPPRRGPGRRDAGSSPRSSRPRCPTSTCSSAPGRRPAPRPRSACRRRAATSSTATSRIPRPARGGSSSRTGRAPTAQPDAYTLAHRRRPRRRLGNAGVVGPVRARSRRGSPTTCASTGTCPPSAAGDIWYGTAVLGTSPATPGDIGSFPVTIHRVADDVDQDGVGRRGRRRRHHRLRDHGPTERHRHRPRLHGRRHRARPASTIDPASVTGGGVVNGQTITWQVTMPTAVGVGRRLRGVDARHQRAVRATCAGFVDLERRRHPRSPASTATPSRSTPSATSGRSSTTASSSRTSSSPRTASSPSPAATAASRGCPRRSPTRRSRTA